MNLSDLLRDFKRKKETIRNSNSPNDDSLKSRRGLKMAINYSEAIESVVKGIFELTLQNMGVEKIDGLAAFLYGSPGRREMVCESDLDVMLVYRDNSNRYKDFKIKFKELAKPFEFCKIDIPEWGTVEEAEVFAKKSITEGNQVLECRFACGDDEIMKRIDSIQNIFGNPDRMARNITFQKFYFDQYFKQRVRNGSINVKYCDGGSRDYLFINWFNELMSRKHHEWDRTRGEIPVAERGISNLYFNGLINHLEFSRAIDALNFNLLFRNEILLANKGTSDEGLTFLDEKTLNSVFGKNPDFINDYEIGSPNEIAERFEEQRTHIAGIKRKIWDLMVEEYGEKLKDPIWASNFHKSYSPLISEEERGSFLTYGDPLIKISTIWGASNSNEVRLLENICGIERDSESWEIQASLATSPHCPADYLHHIATGIGKEKGYGYILRIISRNQNVRRETLEAIAYDPKVESRYTQCAKAELEQGRGAGNHQI